MNSLQFTPITAPSQWSRVATVAVLAIMFLGLGTPASEAVNPCASQHRVNQSYNEAQYQDAQGCGYAKTTVRYMDYYGTTRYLSGVTFSIPSAYAVGIAPGSGTYDVNAAKTCTSIPNAPCGSYSSYYGGSSWNTF